MDQYWELQKKCDEDSIKKALVYFHDRKANYSYSGPLEVNVDVTNKCSQHCYHCFNASNAPASELDPAVIDSICTVNPLSIVLSGGEPFLHSNFLEIVEKCKRRGIMLRILTSGIHINMDMMYRLLKAGMDNTDIIQISLDASSAEAYSDLRGSDTFDYCMRAIKIVAASPIQLSVHTVATKKNSHDIVNIFLLAAENGAQFFSGGALAPLGRASFDVVENSKKLLEIEKKIVDLARNTNTRYIGGISGEVFQCLAVHDIRKSAPRLTKKKDVYTCLACTTSCFVDVYADVYPCVYAKQPELLMGNLKNNNESLHDIWLRHEKGVFTHLKYDQTVCHNCEHLGVCNGGCIGIGYSFSGVLNPGTDPRCYKL